jgi:exodeoxyribonuclease V beta subunit
MNNSEPTPYLNCNIHRGKCSVIEAAAGTGKTFNITNITARIIMERSDVTIDKMVIVTFTRAAAGELKTRISQRLAELEKLVQTEGCKEELIQLALDKGVSKTEIRKRLRVALLNFDRAMIGTIHSFAMRSLSENGFDSRLKFGFTLNENTAKIVLQLCDDFLRGFFYDEKHSEMKPFLQDISKDFSSDISGYVLKRLADPALNISWGDLPELPGEVLTDSALFFECQKKNNANVDAEIQQYKEKRQKQRPSLEAQLPALKERTQSLKKDLDKIKKQLDKADKSGDEEKAAQLQLEFDKIQQEHEEAKQESTTVSKELQYYESRTGAGVKKLEEQYKASSKALLKLLCEQTFEYVSKEFRTLCEEKNFLGNDDLILELQKALYQPGSHLPAKLRESFPVGLIDEFQDTNDSQFAIFRKIFLENPESTFIVVGDPRQAIYRFRNCDIQTYLTAKEEMEKKRNAECFSMNTNRRSGEKYITELNKIFSKGAFAMENMDMPEQHSLPGSRVLLTPQGVEIDFPIEAAYDTALPSSEISKWCAADICKLLKDGFRLPAADKRPERPVESGDITVLTGSWAKAREVRKELEKLGIPARLMKNENVFKSLQAEELAIFLEGVLNCNNHDALLRALITPLGDLTVEMLNSEDAVTERARWMLELNNLWHKRSFMIMYNELFIRFRVNDRLSEESGGNRDLSNFNTIADILCEEAFTKKLTPGALLRTLQKYIQSADDDKENFAARPETDQGTVLIDTVFGSKGLSYPIVYLPDLFYLGKSFDADKVSKTFHDANNILCYAPYLDDNQMKVSRFEAFQENLRKAYVALTRARYYCRIYCGKGSKHCAPTTWLFRKRNAAERLPAETPATAGIEQGYPIHAVKIDGEPPEEKFAPPSPDLLRRPDLMPYLVSRSGFLSFTSITPHGGADNAFTGDKYDEGEQEEETSQKQAEKKEEKLPDTFSLPAGTAFGNAIHTTLELCDYDISEESLLPLVQRQLNIHGLSGEKHGAVTTKMLHRMLNTPIDDGSGGTFKLSEITAADKKCEFEFLYEFGQSFKNTTLFETANAYFEEKFKLRCPELTDQSSTFDNGFFNGSIDLFFRYKNRFYIIDWKTNKLAAPHLYDNGKLCHAMANSRYYLQYMIYTAALFKYLKERLHQAGDEKELYETSIGGVRYIFLRGFTGMENRGVFSDRLPWEMLKKIEEIIG